MITFKITRKTLLILILIVTYAIVSRVYFAYNLPLSGDEVGVGVLQATGQAVNFQKSLPTENVPISEIKKYVEYSADKSVRDVLASLRYRGMHPPFYYLLLHYTIRFFNNDVITLRALSLVFSVLSIVLLFLLGATSISGFVLLSLESFWQPHFANLFGGSEGNTFWFGVIMGGNFLVGMLGNMIVTPVSKALGKRYGLVAAIFQGLRGIILIGLALQSNLPIAVLLFWLVYLNMGAVNSPHSTLLNEQIPSGQRSSMLSIESLASYLGGAIGGVLLGYIAKQLSISTAWMIAGGALVLSLFMYLKIEFLQHKEREIELDGKERPVLETS